MRVAVTRKIPERGIELLRKHADVYVWPEPLPPSPEKLKELAANADGLLTTLNDRIDDKLLASGTNLRVVSNFAVGFDNIDVGACTERKIAACITPDVLTETTADFAFSLLLATARRIPSSVESIRRGEWRTWEPLGFLGQDAYGSTIGIVGMGRIGVAMARRCQGFNMRIVYHDVGRNKDAEKETGARYVEMDELLAESDFISVHVPLTDSTRALFDRNAFRKMKSTAILINTARGPVVDTNALVDALQAGEIWGAGLDVTDPEPLPSDHSLLSIERAVVTPHIASASDETRAQMAELAARNLLAVLQGDSPPRCLNPEVL